MGGIVSIRTVVATSERRRGAILPEAVFGALSKLHTACIFKTLLSNLLFCFCGDCCFEIELAIYMILGDSCSK